MAQDVWIRCEAVQNHQGNEAGKIGRTCTEIAFIIFQLQMKSYGHKSGQPCLWEILVDDAPEGQNTSGTSVSSQRLHLAASAKSPPQNPSQEKSEADRPREAICAYRTFPSAPRTGQPLRPSSTRANRAARSGRPSSSVCKNLL